MAPLPPQGARHPDLVGGLKAIIQQTKGMQLQQPLTLLHIALAPRHVLGVPGIHQIHFQTMLFKNLQHGHPIYASRWQGHAAHALLNQPLPHPTQICCKTYETPHRLGIAVGLTATQCSLPPTSIPAASGARFPPSRPLSFGQTPSVGLSAYSCS
jgi:hypothetical protein